MHYIRFQKPPSVTRSPLDQIVAKITVTSDLGETFLCIDIPLVAYLEDANGQCVASQTYTWRAGSRQLEVSFKIPSGRNILKWPVRMIVKPQDELALRSLNNALYELHNDEHQGNVVPVRSDQLVLQPNLKGPRRVLRKFVMDGQNSLDIWEETGESIARHIWDAGLVLSAYLRRLSKSQKENSQISRLPRLQSILARSRIKVLELGSGCGIVGITVAQSFPSSVVILTDLPDAEEIARFNIATSVSSSTSMSNLSYKNLDWADPMPKNLQNPPEPIDLVLVADCTYNPDVVPDLVSTLSSIVHSKANTDPKTGAGPLVLLAMKVRHDSERIFFDLMEQNHMQVIDKLVLPLPHLGEEDQEIEIYLFSGT